MRKDVALNYIIQMDGNCNSIPNCTSCPVGGLHTCAPAEYYQVLGKMGMTPRDSYRQFKIAFAKYLLEYECV